MHIFSSCKLHPLQRGRVSLVPRLISSVREKEPGYEAKEGSGHTATMELSPRQKLDVANQIRTHHRSHPLSWSTITLSVKRMSSSYSLTSVIAFLGDNSMVVA